MIKYKHLIYIGDKVKFDLELSNDIVVIQGDSGVGKTLLCEAIRVEQEKKEKNMYQDIKIIDIRNKKNIKTILRGKNNLIIIDNADLILTDDLQYQISRDFNNQYIIMGRKEYDFHIPLFSFGELYIKDDEIKINYRYVG